MILKTCAHCYIPYPEELLSPVMVGKVGGAVLESPHTAAVCGICALEITNEVMQMHRTFFTGTLAEEMRQQALQWRRDRGL